MQLINNKKLLILGLLIVLASIPRAIELLNHNYLFGYDQGQFFQDVKKIVIDGNLTLIGTEVGGKGGFFQGPGWYYLLSIPFFITGGDPYGAMILMFLIGVGSVLIAFLLGSKMFDKKTAFTISLLIAISPAVITQSRFIWPPFPISFLSVFLVFSVYQVLHGKEKYLPFLTFILGLMTHFETATAATLLVNLLLFSPILLIKKLVAVRTAFFSMGTLIVTQLPLIFFDLKHDFLNTKGILSLILSTEKTNARIAEVFDNRWEVFKNNFYGTFPSGDMLWPLLLLIILGGIFMYIRDNRKSFAEKSFVLFLAVSPILLFLIFMKYGSFMWSWWILELPIYYCFLLGIIFGYSWKKTFLRLPIVVIIFILFGSYIYQTINFYKNDFNDFGGVHKIKGKIQAIDYIYKDAAGKPFNIMIFTPPVYTYAYDYLLWWHGRKKYNFIPEKKKEDAFYLLIEPDPHKPWTYKGWLETVVKTGKVTKTVELPSGFIIQKRYED
ncbi:MAG: hypothetical protein A2687_01550 [Candidatus Levybacteria bacterium RIFCSPHIGHO2_01_FULL_38_26]|nr:MAG: hypothetical protein A2687_01550 [Candidatus Levybacteria bacterium RIFCSPHIGHO2_01_FULL_38_26]